MKKRLYNLLALGLALCMALATPATALAVVKYDDTSAEALPVGTELEEDATVYADKAGIATYHDFNESTGTYTGTTTHDFDAGYFQILSTESGGYVCRITENYDYEDKTYVTFDRTLISYTIEYYDNDQTTLLYKAENVTVENAEQHVIPTATKDGYIFSHWVPASSGGEVPPGLTMDTFFLVTQGHPDYNYVIKMVAAWTKLPATGDDTPIGMLVMLTMVSLACFAGLYAYRKRSF